MRRSGGRGSVWVLAGARRRRRPAWIAYPHVRARVIPPEETSAARGHRLAVSLGCFACHGPGGGGGDAQPGQRGRRGAGVHRADADDVREDDRRSARVHPRRRAEAAARGSGLRRQDGGGGAAHAGVPRLRRRRAARGPGRLPTRDLGSDPPRREARGAGAELAIELDCFACHGPLGAGGVPNPGSFKGYIPGFWGDDFDELVRDDDELREWIADGQLDRIAEHPIGGIFFRRQAIKMPAYGRFGSEDDIDALMAYVRWVRAGAWRPLTR